MKNSFLSFFVLAMSLLSFPVFSQTENDTTLLGLPGDNLDLYAVLDLFQKSKTIEEFEKTLNLKETGINNLDLNLDDKVDFIKVVTKQDGKDFTFILQVDVTEKEKQDVAVILVSKDKNDKVTLQIVGDKDLYGKDYVIEPKPATPPVTPNPGYTGTEPVTESSAGSTTVVVVESAPIVQYVYSPVYVPYAPPYYYGYYPPYFAAVTVMAVGIYRHNNYYYHGGYHGGYGHSTVVVHNNNNYNNYNSNRNTSNTVNNNRESGNYNNGTKAPVIRQEDRRLRNNPQTICQKVLPVRNRHQTICPRDLPGRNRHQTICPKDLLHQNSHQHQTICQKDLLLQNSHQHQTICLGSSSSKQASTSIYPRSVKFFRIIAFKGSSYSGGGGSRGGGGYSGGGGARGGGGGSRGGGGRR